MNETTTTITPEIMPDTPAEQNKLALVASQYGLAANETATLEAAFGPFFKQADSWAKQVAQIHVTDASQTGLMKLARTGRLELKRIRCEVESKRIELKAAVVSRGKAIDGMANVIKFAIEPLETSLFEQEQFVERQEAARKAKLKEVRSADLIAIGGDPTLYSLGEMSEETWQQLIGGLKYAKEQAAEKARKEEAARISAVEADRKAREEQRLENERLRKEAAEKEAALKAEREKAKQEQDAREESARVERAAMLKREAAAKAERLKLEQEAAEALRLERIAAANAAKLAAEQARKEREAIEAKARAEREAAEAEFRKQRKEEQDRAFAAAEKVRKTAQAEREAREKAEAAITAQKAKEAARVEAEKQAAAKAAAAPDQEKLIAFAETVRALKAPDMATPAGKAVALKLAGQITKFAGWIDGQAATLEDWK